MAEDAATAIKPDQSTPAAEAVEVSEQPDTPLVPYWDADAAVPVRTTRLVPDLVDGRPRSGCVPLLPPGNPRARRAGIRLLHHQQTHLSLRVPLRWLPDDVLYLEPDQETILPRYDYGEYEPGPPENLAADPGLHGDAGGRSAWITQRADGTMVARPPLRLEGAAMRMGMGKTNGLYQSRLFVVGRSAAMALYRLASYRPAPEQLDPDLSPRTTFSAPVIAAIIHHDIDRDGLLDAIGFFVYTIAGDPSSREYLTIVVATGDGAPLRSASAQFTTPDFWFVPYFSIPPMAGQPPLLMSLSFCCAAINAQLMALESNALRTLQSGFRTSAPFESADDGGPFRTDTLCLERSSKVPGRLHVGSRIRRRGESTLYDWKF